MRRSFAVLKACSHTSGRHVCVAARAKRGLESSGESVVHYLVKCGNLDEAVHVFHRLPERTVVSWTAVISGYGKAGKYEEAVGLYQYMREQGVEPNKYTLVSVLKACGNTGNLEQGKRIHADVVKYGRDADLYVVTCLLDMYAKCGSTVDAQAVFDRMPQPDVVSWTSIVAAYVEQGESDKALGLYQQMQEEGVHADRPVFIKVLQACAGMAEKEKLSRVHGKGYLRVRCLQTGLAIHAEAWRRGFDSDIFVGSTLISMYAKCGAMSSAQQVFAGLPGRNIVSWNALLAGYVAVQESHADQVWQLYLHMKEEGVVSPDARTLVSVLQACGGLAEQEESTPVSLMEGDGQSLVRMESLRKGKVMHAEAQRCGCASSDVFVGSALVSMYAKCGSVMDAQVVVNSLPHRNVVLWNALLAGYAQQGEGERAMDVYYRMQEEAVSPDDRTFVTLLQACGSCAEKEEASEVDGQALKVEALQDGRAIHAHVCKKGCERDTFVSNSLVSLYAKCGSIVDAQNVFDRLVRRDVVTWNAMIAGYVQKKGQSNNEALQLYDEMREQGVSPDARTLVSVLQACAACNVVEGGGGGGGEDDMLCGIGGGGECDSTRMETLNLVRRVHGDAEERHLEVDAFLGNTLVTMYARLGSIVEAQRVFDGLSHRDIVVWNSLLLGYAQEQGDEEKALDLYVEMRGERGVSPDERTFVNLFHACGNLGAHADGQGTESCLLHKSKALHAEAYRRGYAWEEVVGVALISMYAKYGSIVEAQSVLDELLVLDEQRQWEACWTAMLTAHAQRGDWDQVVQLYSEMLEAGVSPSDRALVTVLQACGNLAEREEFVVVGDGGGGEGQVVLVGVESLKAGKEIHAHSCCGSSDVDDAYIGNTLISMYGKCGSVVDAEHVFSTLGHRDDVVSWSVMLAAYVQQPGEAELVFEVYEQMHEAGVTPDDRVLVCLLQACGSLAEQEETTTTGPLALKGEALQRAKAAAAEVTRAGLDANVFICNTLISTYAKCGSLTDARDVFDRVAPVGGGTVVTWNAMLAGYAEQEGRGGDALELYARMLQSDASPDDWSVVSALQACGGVAAEREEPVLVDGHLLRPKALHWGRALHQEACRRGYASDVFVCTALVSMYGKCGSVGDARLVFDTMAQRGSGSSVEWWNAMLGACVQQGEWDHAMLLLQQMQWDGGGGGGGSGAAVPDATTYARVLRMCGHTGALGLCTRVHASLAASGADLGAYVAPALITAYAKCASVAAAQAVFDALPQPPDAAAWNALAVGYARQGDVAACLARYDAMRAAGVAPTGVTFLVLLSACSHAGLVDAGVAHFQSMARDHGIPPDADHYAAVVDLLARAGCFDRVDALVAAMPVPPTPALWLALLNACRTHGHVALARRAFDAAVGLDPSSAAPYIVMRNVYAHAGMWDAARAVDEAKARAGAWKKPGQSWIEHGQAGVLHAFGVGEPGGRRSSQEEPLPEQHEQRIRDLSGTLSEMLKHAASNHPAGVSVPSSSW